MTVLRWRNLGTKIPTLGMHTRFSERDQSLTTHPEFRRRCQSPPPQSRRIFQPCRSLDQDPRLSLSEYLPPHPLLLQTGCKLKKICTLTKDNCKCALLKRIPRGRHWKIPAWDGLASPGDADSVFTRFQGVIFTMIDTISCILHFNLLLCSS